MSTELACDDPAQGAIAKCELVRHYLGGRSTAEPVQRVSSHPNATLSDDAPEGPKLLIETAGGPMWFMDERTTEQTLVHQRRLPLPPIGGISPFWGIGAGVACLFGAFLMSLSTTLVADLTRGTLRVRRWTLTGPRWWTLELDELGTPATTAIEDSAFVSLRLGLGAGAVSVVATAEVCQRAIVFLHECRSASRAVRGVDV